MGRLRVICAGEAGISEKTRNDYIDHWLRTGALDADPRENHSDGEVSPPRKTPNLTRKILQFARAAAVHVADRLRQAGPRTRQARIEICVACPAFKAGTCEVCGCNLSVKVRWRTSKCPEGKW